MAWVWLVVLVALVGGFSTKILRDQQRYRLLRVALDRGATGLPGELPVWAASLRQGVRLLGLGVALIVAGVFVWAAAPSVAMPVQQQPPTRRQPLPAQAAPAGGEANGTVAPAATSRDQSLPPRMRPLGFHRHGPGGPGPRFHRGRRAGHRPGPPPDPQMVAWMQARTQKMCGMAAVAVGIVMAILGVVRAGMARWEKRTLAIVHGGSGGDHASNA